MTIHEPRALAVGLVLTATMLAALAVGVRHSAIEVRQALREERRLAPGRRAPELQAMPRAKSSPLNLASLRGHNAVLFFSRPPYRGGRIAGAADPDMDLIQKLGRQLPARTRIVVVQLEGRARTGGANATFVNDAEATAFRAYRAFPSGLPKVVVIDGQGIIRHVTNRLRAETFDNVVREVRKLPDVE